MKVLLTGASGFLGSALALHLRETGHDVALLLRPSSSLKRLDGRDGDFDIGRCGSDAEIGDFVASTNPDAVIHTACAYGRVGETTLQILDANVRLGVALLQALSTTGKAVNFINTGTVLASDVSAYALSKNQFSDWGRRYAGLSEGKLRFINVRLQHMYGPGDDASKFTTYVLHACHRNDPALRLTAGEQMRDFVYIDDVVSAYATLLEQSDSLESIVDIDVGSGDAPAVRKFVEIVHALTKSNSELQFGAVAYRPNEAMFCKADIARMQALGWQPKFDLSTGIKKTIELEF